MTEQPNKTREEPQRLHMQHYRSGFQTYRPGFCDRIVVHIEARYCDGLKNEIADKMHELCMEIKYRLDNHVDKYMR